MGTRKPKRPRIDIREKFAQRQQGGEAGDSDDSDDSGNNSSSSSGGFATGGKLKKQGEDDKKKKSKNKKDDDDDDEEEEEAYFSDGIHSKPKGKPCRRKWKARRKKKEAKCVDDEIRNLGFCCEVCTCDQDKMEELLPPGSSEGFVHTFVKSQEENLWHRRCCHEALDNDSNWVTLYDEVREEATEANAKVKEITQEKKEKKNSSSSSSNSAAGVELEWVTDVEIQKAYEVSKRQESELYNSDGLEDPQWKLSSHPDYNAAVEEPFEAHRRRCLEGAPQGRKPAVVVDAFGNIGTAIIVLKRLCIDISKIIHIEHDKVATHVSRYNHDITYNPNLPRQDGDSIEHVYYSTWEEFQQNLEPIMKEHGPFDIIIGGPPCYDYTKVNARREGHEGEQGQYMLDFGRTIREIERYQQPHLLYFLAENVRLSGKDKQEVMDAFGLDWDPIELDAKYLSPCRRDRHWFTNIPFRYLDCQSPVSLQGPESCLEDGYSIPAHIVDPNTTAKANCIMGSKSRIDERDSLRMYVFQTKPRIHKNQIVYRGRPMTISEREKLMGYPDQYVEKAGTQDMEDTCPLTASTKLTGCPISCLLSITLPFFVCL